MLNTNNIAYICICCCCMIMLWSIYDGFEPEYTLEEILMKILGKKKKKRMSQVKMGTLYDINKSIIENNIEPLTKEELEEKKILISSFMKSKENKYFMLLCNDRKDYTIFNILSTEENIVNILVDECLPNRGQVKSIAQTEDNAAIEIWISIDKESYCYYFFPYDLGVIEG